MVMFPTHEIPTGLNILRRWVGGLQKCNHTDSGFPMLFHRTSKRAVTMLVVSSTIEMGGVGSKCNNGIAKKTDGPFLWTSIEASADTPSLKEAKLHFNFPSHPSQELPALQAIFK